MGIDPQGRELKIAPSLPDACPEMTIRSMQYHNVLMDVRCTNNSVALALREKSVEPIVVILDGNYKNTSTGEVGSRFELAEIGAYRFVRL